MTTDDAPGLGLTPADEVLQFDHAEFTAAPAFLICGGCGQPIRDAYYEIQGNVLCGRCRDQIVARFAGRSAPAHFARAVLFGVGAALAGAALFLLVLLLIGTPIYLLYVVLGYMVGAAIRKGAGYRGGWQYQVLAVILTYSGIASCVIQPIILSMVKQGIAIGPNLVPLVFIGYAAPFLAGLKDIMGLVIIGFALLQAWRLNAKLKLPITGPFQVSGGSSPPLQEAPAHV